MSIAALQTVRRHVDDPAGFLDQAIVLARAAKLAYGSDATPIAQALVFRGTMNPGHWRSNLQFLPPERPNHPWGKGRDLRPEGALTKAVPWTADHACDRYVENLEAIRRLQPGPAAALHLPMAQ